MDFNRYEKDLYKYEKLEKTKMLGEGNFLNRHYVIGRNKLCDPVAYVELKNDEDEDVENLYSSVTYSGEAYWNGTDDRRYVGWDYGHSSDYSIKDDLEMGISTGHKYNWAEILMDIAGVIGELNTKANG